MHSALDMFREKCKLLCENGLKLTVNITKEVETYIMDYKGFDLWKNPNGYYLIRYTSFGYPVYGNNKLNRMAIYNTPFKSATETKRFISEYVFNK